MPGASSWWDDETGSDAGGGTVVAPPEVVSGSKSVNWGTGQGTDAGAGAATVPDLPAPKEFPASRDVSLSINVPTGTAEKAPPPEEDRTTRAKPRDELVRAVLDAVGPGAFLKQQAEVKRSAQEVQDNYRREQEMLTGRLTDRHDLEMATMQMFQDFRKGLAEARPTPPTLQKMPGVPDLKVRPWLDPEGKNALVVIAQGLGMLATGISGVVLNAPNTALKQFRLAAEAWRRDEIDAANSNLNQFQATVEQIKGDNQTALQEYEIADRQYTSNLVAKQAAVASRLQELNLHDQATVAASMPFELGRQAAQAQLRTSSLLLEQLTRYASVARNWMKATTEKPPKTFGEAVGRSEGLKQRIQDTQDPDDKAQLQRELQVSDAVAKRLHDDAIQRNEAFAGIRTAAVQVPKMDAKLADLDRFAYDAIRFDDAVQKLAKNGVLPSNQTPLSEWGTWIQRNFSERWKRPEVQEAYQTVLQLTPTLLVTYERSIENMIGPRFRESFAIPRDPSLLSAHRFKALTKMFFGGAEQAKLRYEERRNAYKNLVPSFGGTPTTGGTEGGAGGGDDQEQPEESEGE